jgi:hypothetical protein
MKIFILAFLTTAIPLSFAVAQQNELPRAKMTVRVLDESGQPINNAEVRIQFTQKIRDLPDFAIGNTDLSGEFEAEGYSKIFLSADVRKDGYYSSATPRFLFKSLTNGMWYPWNPMMQVILRKIGNPVPMYAKAIRSTIPESRKPCGYDLKAGDWVTPYGKGKTSDFIFTWTNSPRPNYDWDATALLTFSNPLDGIQEAHLDQYTNTIFRWPRQAPDAGYKPLFTAREAWPTGGNGKAITTFDPYGRQAYFFRVRTVVQDGKIVSALYGKIDGGIGIDPSRPPSCGLLFNYFLNPTPLGRNMEFDLKRNLLTNLPFLEQPRRP